MRGAGNVGQRFRLGRPLCKLRRGFALCFNDPVARLDFILLILCIGAGKSSARRVSCSEGQLIPRATAHASCWTSIPRTLTRCISANLFGESLTFFVITILNLYGFEVSVIPMWLLEVPKIASRPRYHQFMPTKTTLKVEIRVHLT